MKKRMLSALVISIALFSACSGNRSNESAYKNLTADSASVSDQKALSNETDTANVNPKLVKTAEMQFKVKDALKAGETITGLVNQHGGMVMNHHLETTVNDTRTLALNDDSVRQVSAFTTTDEMIVRVPQRHLAELMSQVSYLSTQVTLMKMDVDDRTINYMEAAQKARNRADVVTYQQKEKASARSAASLLALKDEKTNREIDNIRTDAETKYSTLSLNFTQNTGVSIQKLPNTDLSAYGLPAGQRLWHAVQNGWEIFSDVLIGILNLWVFVLLALAGWLGYRFYKKRQVKPIVANI